MADELTPEEALGAALRAGRPIPPEDLTDAQRTAVCMLAGVPMTQEIDPQTGAITMTTTVPCRITLEGGGYVVNVRPAKPRYQAVLHG